MSIHQNSTNSLAHKASYLLTAVLLVSLMPIAVNARTPDGQTPAQEGVCDPLKADGVTKGLYGLCVAFCEAQDFASVDMPLTDEEIAAFEESRPSANLLKNYNKKKKDTDPDMPCVVKQASTSCPCWNSEELENIDGINNDQPSIQLTFGCNNENTANGTKGIIFESTSDSQGDALAYGLARESISAYGTYRYCAYNDKYNSTNTFRYSLNLPEDNFAACYSAIIAKCSTQ